MATSIAFIYTSYWYNVIDEMVGQIDENDNLLYYNDYNFYYKGEKKNLGNYVSNVFFDRICFINGDYLICLKQNAKSIDYYLMDHNGSINLIYTSKDECYIDAYIDDSLYFTTNKYLGKNIKYIAYNVYDKIESEMSIEDYYSTVYNTKYLLTYGECFRVIDTFSKVAKDITIDRLLTNSIVNNLYEARKRLMNSSMTIMNVYFIDNDIYIDVSIDNKNGITLKYDFESEKIDIVGKVCFEWLEHIKSSYLFDGNCKPIEKILSKYCV
ncbi:MAG: hypothetical protein J6X93_04355 [Bacilli bacterium]|nr:hypothetical protein [Bacilli bacterium]